MSPDEALEAAIEDLLENNATCGCSAADVVDPWRTQLYLGGLHATRDGFRVFNRYTLLQ